MNHKELIEDQYIDFGDDVQHYHHHKPSWQIIPVLLVMAAVLIGVIRGMAWLVLNIINLFAK